MLIRDRGARVRVWKEINGCVVLVVRWRDTVWLGGNDLENISFLFLISSATLVSAEEKSDRKAIINCILSSRPRYSLNYSPLDGRVSPGIGWCLQSPGQDNCLFCHNNKYIQREERRFVYLSFYSGLEQDTCSERRYWSRKASSNLPLLTIHSIIFLLTASPPWEPLHIKDMFLIWSDIGGWKHF